MLLNCVGLFYSGYESDELAALGNFADLVTLIHREQTLVSSDTWQTSANNPDQEQQWDAWIDEEMRRRLGYCTWVGDFLQAARQLLI